MRIGELARLVGVSTSALRYYERAGLVEPPDRSPGGYRIFGQAASDRLRFVQRGKALGVSERQVRELVASPHADVGAERDRVRHLVAHKLAETRRRSRS